MQANRFSSVKQRTHGLTTTGSVGFSGALVVADLIDLLSLGFSLAGGLVVESVEEEESFVDDWDVVISTSPTGLAIG